MTWAGPGERGGEAVFFGAISELLDKSDSLTARYLTGRKLVSPERPAKKQKVANQTIAILGASEHNLKNIDVDIPLGRLVCITGVSGSGKSTLVQDILYNGIKKYKMKPVETPGAHKSITGLDLITDVVLVNQAQIGKTTRSNPASFVGAFDAIRKTFASQPLAAQRSYTAGTFSFNSGDGRCPTCGGNGFEHVEMQFLSDVYLRCPDCDGKRFRPEVLEVTISPPVNLQKEFHALSIADVLELTVEDASWFFSGHHSIVKALQPLRAVGLSYIRLGQPLPTLSGGEAQRLKLAGHLAEKSEERGILFLFDEPTTGLHFDDIAVLLTALRELIDAGNSVVVIEHNLDVIRAADWIIDLGPEGGEAGGKVVCTGTPEAIKKCHASFTGTALKEYDRGYLTKKSPGTRKKLPAIELNHDITIRNAREHNLQNITMKIPRDRFTVITGVSGSGKSTVAFDILFAEGQRRYLESLNAYARQFVRPHQNPMSTAYSGCRPPLPLNSAQAAGAGKHRGNGH